MKDRILTITLSIVCAFGSVMLANRLSGKQAQTEKYEQRIKSVEENKADKRELEEFKAENTRMHEAEKNDMKDYFNTRFEDLKSFMIELNKRK